MKIFGLILAAGASKRMETPKAVLLHLDGKTLLTKQVELLRSGGCEKVLVVIGAAVKLIKDAHSALGVTWVENKNWEMGQFSSLQTGFKKMSKSNIDGVLVLPIDTVGVKVETIKKILRYTSCFMSRASSFIPTYQDSPGHPVLLTKSFIDRLIKIKPNASDARLDKQMKIIKTTIIDVDDPNVCLNINSKVEWKSYIDNSFKNFASKLPHTRLRY